MVQLSWRTHDDGDETAHPKVHGARSDQAAAKERSGKESSRHQDSRVLAGSQDADQGQDSDWYVPPSFSGCLLLHIQRQAHRLHRYAGDEPRLVEPACRTYGWASAHTRRASLRACGCVPLDAASESSGGEMVEGQEKRTRPCNRNGAMVALCAPHPGEATWFTVHM